MICPEADARRHLNSIYRGVPQLIVRTDIIGSEIIAIPGADTTSAALPKLDRFSARKAGWNAIAQGGARSVTRSSGFPRTEECRETGRLPLRLRCTRRVPSRPTETDRAAFSGI